MCGGIDPIVGWQVIRIANEKYLTKARSVADRFGMLLKSGHFGPVADVEKLSAERASVLNPSVQTTLRALSGGLQMVYRYFALMEDLKGGGADAKDKGKRKKGPEENVRAHPQPSESSPPPPQPPHPVSAGLTGILRLQAQA